jgi:hypothetical protein
VHALTCSFRSPFCRLSRFMMSQARYAELAKKLKPNDVEGTPYRTHEWLKRFRNIFTTLVTKSMVRHEKGLLFRGRATLLVLPAARVEVIRVQLTPTQRAAYKLLFEFAKSEHSREPPCLRSSWRRSLFSQQLSLSTSVLSSSAQQTIQGLQRLW